MGDTYQCAACGGVYEKVQDDEWNDDLARAETVSTFGPVPETECEVVCDDCYRKMMGLADAD